MITRKTFAAPAALAAALSLMLPVAVGGAALILPEAAVAQGKSDDRGGGNDRGGEDRGGDRGNGNRGGGEEVSAHSNGNGNGNGRGAVASELKGMNAMYASQQARDNAAPNSQVGRIATYQTAALEAQGAYEAWQDAVAAYNDLLANPPAETAGAIQDEIDLLDPASATYAADLATLTEALTAAQLADANALTAYDAELDQLSTTADGLMMEYETSAAAEGDALLAASGGRTLSAGALAELRAALGL